MLTLKSAEPVTPEQFLEAQEQMRKASPLKVAMDPRQTSAEVRDDKLIVAKRTATIAVLTRDVADLETLAQLRGFDFGDGDADRVISYWASDERVDRHGDIVEQSWNFDEYEENPIMLDSHDWGGATIGGLLDWEVTQRDDGKYKGEALRVDALFAKAEVYPWADTIFRLAKAGFMSSGSVGFWPEQVLDVKDREERKTLGLGDKGFIFRGNRLVEWSPTAVPANVGAHRLRRVKSMGLLKADDAPFVRELMRRQALTRVGHEEAEWQALDGVVSSTIRMMFPGIKLAQHKDVSQPFLPDEVVVPKTGGNVAIEDVHQVLSEISTRLANIESSLETITGDNPNPAPNKPVPGSHDEEEPGEGTPEEEQQDAGEGDQQDQPPPTPPSKKPTKAVDALAAILTA